MTAKAIELLDGGVASPSKFFLQVEGASIDKQAHAANPCGQIGETLAFDRAVRIGIDYARDQPGTLLIVTADHAHASQIVGHQTDSNHAGGLLSVLWTADHSAMTVLYATNAVGRLQDHTGTQVRVAAMGPLADQISGIHDQTDLYWLMAKALGERPARDVTSRR